MKNTFVDNLRKLRKNEIENYKSKGYIILNETDYIYNDCIKVVYQEKQYNFGLRVNGNEFYFYIMHEGSRIYLTIYDIYKLFWNLVILDGKIYILDYLKNFFETKEEISFEYKEKEYFLRNLPKDIKEEDIQLENSDITISMIELLLLVYLIQEKSNGLELKGKTHEYVDGLVRLIYVLLKHNKSHYVLDSLGWHYDEEESIFKISKPNIKGRSLKKRYYLTCSQERSIMK